MVQFTLEPAEKFCALILQVCDVKFYTSRIPICTTDYKSKALCPYMPLNVTECDKE